MADSNVVFPKFTGWVGEAVYLNEGEPWAADDPFVIENPRHFRSVPGASLRRTTVPEPAPVEQATAEPGEKRTTRRSSSPTAEK